MKLATLCYIERNNQYLMLHRNKKEHDMHEGLWVGLGGKFEAGESPEDCVVREVYEESGLKIKNPKLRGIMTFPNDFNQEDWYVFLFFATDFSGVLKPSSEGDLSWVDKSKLDDLPMHEADRYFIKWMQKNEGIFSAKYIYETGVLKEYQITVYKD